MANFSEKPSVFPSINEFKHPIVEQEEYLVNGEFNPWNKDFNEVYSAV